MTYQILYVCSTNRRNRKYVSVSVDAETEATAITVGREQLFNRYGFTSVRKKKVQLVDHQYRVERVRPETKVAEEYAVQLLSNNPSMSHGLAIHLAAKQYKPEDVNLIAYRKELAKQIFKHKGI